MGEVQARKKGVNQRFTLLFLYGGVPLTYIKHTVYIPQFGYNQVTGIFFGQKCNLFGSNALNGSILPNCVWPLLFAPRHSSNKFGSALGLAAGGSTLVVQWQLKIRCLIVTLPNCAWPLPFAPRHSSSKLGSALGLAAGCCGDHEQNLLLILMFNQERTFESFALFLTLNLYSDLPKSGSFLCNLTFDAHDALNSEIFPIVKIPFYRFLNLN